MPFRSLFFIGAFVFDGLFVFSGNAAFKQTAYYLDIAGITGALVAAIPGAIDYFYTIPPKSSAKKRGTQHAVLNLLNVAIFGFALYYRGREDSISGVVLAIEGAGVFLLSIAGWMGGTLVHRNQIGIDHRYANAGKWTEIRVGERGRVRVAAADELKINSMKLVHAGTERIVIARTEKGFSAFSDHCTHRGGSLADGVLICGTVHCLWHGSQFDVSTGAVKCGPATERIRTYAVEQKANGQLVLASPPE